MAGGNLSRRGGNVTPQGGFLSLDIYIYIYFFDKNGELIIKWIDSNDLTNDDRHNELTRQK